MSIELSNRSSIPPCPGSNFEVSLTPISLLYIDSIKSLNCPTIPTMIPSIKLSTFEIKGARINFRPIEDPNVTKNPPIAPSHVLFGLIR